MPDGEQISLLSEAAPGPIWDKVYVGTCSWAEKSFVRSEFYPRAVRSASDRLRYYATRFPTVEVDASYFALLPAAYSRKWAEETPPGFVMHAKAFGLFTGHAVSTRRLPQGFTDLLPAPLREAAEIRAGRVPGEDGSRAADLPEEFLNACWDRFREFLAPLAASGKLGYVLFQLPPGTRCAPDVLEAMHGWVRELAGYRLAVEFRHRDWARHPEAFDELTRLGLTYVMVDLPDLPWLMPLVETATSDWAVLRLHGRNRDGWARAGASTDERYNYDYSEDELLSWAQVVGRLGQRVTRLFAMFNNHVRGNMARNAQALQGLLEAMEGGSPA